MINLLPPNYKKELLEEEYYKIVLVLGFFAIIFLISLASILFSVNIYVSSQFRVEKQLSDEFQKEMEFSEIRQLEDEIKLINQEISQVSLFYQEQISLVEILNQLYEIMPQGIYFKSVSLNPISEEGHRFLISVSGFSPSRDLLLELENNLKAKQEIFKFISFPSSTWTKPSDIDFSLNLKI